MVKRWILYAACLIGGIVFYFAYQEWFAWFTLVAILLLPVVSLLLSLPAMTGLRTVWSGQRVLHVGAEETVALEKRCKWPMPLTRCRVKVTRLTTGETWLLEEGRALPTQHCGVLRIRPFKPMAYDYLGLLGLRLRRLSGVDVLVLPEPVPVDNVPTMGPGISRAWKPKPGGGFSENHEMRLYRPGDKLNQVHWKLSSKVGKLMVREAMEPVRDRVLVEMVVSGDAGALDRKFGQLLWVSRWLLSMQIPHELRVLGGEGTVSRFVEDIATQQVAMAAVMDVTPAPPGAQLEAVRAAWQYRIGGDADAQ